MSEREWLDKKLTTSRLGRLLCWLGFHDWAECDQDDPVYAKFPRWRRCDRGCRKGHLRVNQLAPLAAAAPPPADTEAGT